MQHTTRKRRGNVSLKVTWTEVRILMIEPQVNLSQIKFFLSKTKKEPSNCLLLLSDGQLYVFTSFQCLLLAPFMSNGLGPPGLMVTWTCLHLTIPLSLWSLWTIVLSSASGPYSPFLLAYTCLLVHEAVVGTRPKWCTVPIRVVTGKMGRNRRVHILDCTVVATEK